MNKGNLVLMALAISLLVFVVGCSGGDNEATEATTEAATEATTEVAETHDCDGPCPMKDVAMDHLTEINGKFYCAGCAVKAKADAEAEAGEAEDSHEGHSHG